MQKQIHFFCFTNLMSEIRDFFIKSLDEAEFGINSMMGKLTTQVKVNDPEVWMRLHQQELCPQYYSLDANASSFTRISIT